MWSLHSEIIKAVLHLNNTLLDEPVIVLLLQNGLDIQLTLKNTDWQIKDFLLEALSYEDTLQLLAILRVMHVDAM